PACRLSGAVRQPPGHELVVRCRDCMRTRRADQGARRYCADADPAVDAAPTRRIGTDLVACLARLLRHRHRHQSAVVRGGLLSTARVHVLLSLATQRRALRGSFRPHSARVVLCADPAVRIAADDTARVAVWTLPDFDERCRDKSTLPGSRLLAACGNLVRLL